MDALDNLNHLCYLYNMTNTLENIQVGKRYKVFTHHVRVVRITDQHIEVVHAINGQTPRRNCDRYFPLHWTKHFQEYT
jgi:hypothetical protein